MENSKYLREPDVLKRVPFSKPTLYRQIKEGSFPAPVKVGTRAVAWLAHEIDAWEAKLISERDARLAQSGRQSAA